MQLDDNSYLGIHEKDTFAMPSRYCEALVKPYLLTRTHQVV